MNTATKLTLGALAGVSLASLALWWFADHRRGIAWAVSVVRRRFPDVSHLSPSVLDDWLHDGQRPLPQIVDARSEEEFAVSHLASARRIDPHSSPSASLSELDPERPIVIYCSAGHRGATLARRLQNAGCREVWNLEGGIFAWANAGLPIERAGQNTERVHPYSRLFTRLLKRQNPDSSLRIAALATVDNHDPLNSTWTADAHDSKSTQHSDANAYTPRRPRPLPARPHPEIRGRTIEE